MGKYRVDACKVSRSIRLAMTLIVLLVFGFLVYYSFDITRVPVVFASPDTLTLRPNAAGTYQAWSTFGTGSAHWDRTSDQNDATGVQVTGSTSLKETENLADTSQTGTINSVTAYIRAKVINSAPETVYPITNMNFTSNSFGWTYTEVDAKGYAYNGGWQSSGGNTLGSSGGNFRVCYNDTSSNQPASSVTDIMRITMTFMTPSSSWSSQKASFAWKYALDSGSYSTQVLTVSARLLDVSDVLLETLYSTTTMQTSWQYQTGLTIATSLSASTAYKLQLQFSIANGGSGNKANIFQVSIYWDDAGVSFTSDPVEQAVILWRTYSTDYESSATTISRTAFTDYSEQRTQNPNSGSAWTWTEVNALEIGSRASALGSTETIQVSEYRIVVDYTAAGYKLNLRVMDWDLADAISGAYVYKDSNVQISDTNGWANWTLVSGTVQVKVKYFGFWVNGTFSVTMDSDKTINVQCKLYDVTVKVQEAQQNAYLVSANVTVFNASSTSGNKIKSGVTGSNGQVSFTNLPNNTLVFTQYGGSSYTIVIGNATQTVSSENQSITLTSNQNYASTSSPYSIIALIGIIIPLKRRSQPSISRENKVKKSKRKWQRK